MKVKVTKRIDKTKTHIFNITNRKIQIHDQMSYYVK